MNRTIDDCEHFVIFLNKTANLLSNEKVHMKRTSITLEDSVYEAGLEIASNRGFSQSFSAYVGWLIQRDAEGGVTREEAPGVQKTKPRGRKPRVEAPSAPTHRRGRRKAARK